MKNDDDDDFALALIFPKMWGLDPGAKMQAKIARRMVGLDAKPDAEKVEEDSSKIEFTEPVTQYKSGVVSRFFGFILLVGMGLAGLLLIIRIVMLAFNFVFDAVHAMF